MPSNPKHSPRGIPRDVLFTATLAPLLRGYTLRRLAICKLVKPGAETGESATSHEMEEEDKKHVYNMSAFLIQVMNFIAAP